MEEFEFPCPKCGEPLISDEETGGTEAVCPYCDKLIILPKTPPPSSAPSAPSAPAATARPIPENSHLPKRRQSGHPLPGDPDIVVATRSGNPEPTHLPSGRNREARENFDRLSAMASGPQIDPLSTAPTKGKVSFHCPGCARLIWIRPRDGGMVVNCSGCSLDVICPSPGKGARLLHAGDVNSPQTLKADLPSKRSDDHLPAASTSARPAEGSTRTLLPSGPSRPGRTLDDAARPDPLSKPTMKPIPKQRDIEISPSELKRYRAASRERKIKRATAPHEEFKSPESQTPTIDSSGLPPARRKMALQPVDDIADTSGATQPGGHRLNPERVPKFSVREDLEQPAGDGVDTWGSDSSHAAGGTRRLLLLALVVGLPALAAAVYFGMRGQTEAPTVPVSESPADNSIDEYEAAESLLKKFLAAKTIEERLPLVRHPEATRQRMEVRETQGHLPFPQVAELQWPESGWISGKKFTWIDVKFNDGTSRTAVFESTPEGPKLDWESFVLFADPLMSDFVSRQPTEPAVYRVVCTLDDYYNRLYKDEYKYLCLKLVGADEVSTCWAYTNSNSEIARELARLFAANGQPVERAGESRVDAIKIMLKIHFEKDENGESNSQAWVDAIVSESWMIP